MLQELIEVEKQLKEQVRQSEAEVTGRWPHSCQTWSGMEMVSADCLPKHPQNKL